MSGILTGLEIYGRNIVTGCLSENIQQQGVDVRVVGINELSGVGYLPATGKTILPKYAPVPTFTKEGDVIVLNPGYYELVLEEGCDIPTDCAIWLKARSSLVRMGGNIFSGQFDAGFKTEHMGCFLEVSRQIELEFGARVAQAITFTSNDVENSYNGQFQNDKQRQ